MVTINEVMKYTLDVWDLLDMATINKVVLVVRNLYSRDHQGLSVAHEKSPKNQPHFSHMTMWQYWLGKTKPKNVFRLTRNAFNKLLQNLKIFYLTEFSTDWLPRISIPFENYSVCVMTSTRLNNLITLSRKKNYFSNGTEIPGN